MINFFSQISMNPTILRKNYKFKIVFVILLMFFSISGKAQLTIVNSTFQSFNVAPQSLCGVSIMNPGAEMKIALEAKVSGNSGELILKVRTGSFLIKGGINNISNISLPFTSVEYGTSQQANYVRTMHILPSGIYNYCCRIVEHETEIGDEYCDEIESNMNSFLNLVMPYDNDTIDGPNPLLVWTHSEPFNVLGQNEYFRMIVTSLETDQTPEAAISTNLPLYYNDFLTTHQVLYPFDAKELEKGNKYAWQVQKINGGNIIDKTEAWAFVLPTIRVVKDNKYVTLKKKLDASCYIAANNKIFFKFDEDYYSTQLRYNIYDEKHQKVNINIKPDASKTIKGKVELKSIGANLYLIDLSSFSISSGVYTLEVINEKDDVYLLKFKVED